MPSTTPHYFLFPYTALSDRDCRLLSLLLPRLSVLQVIRPPTVPAWLQEQVTGWPVLTEPEDLKNVELCLKGYREFAVVHGENSVLSSLSLDQISRNFAETRFHLQAELKEKSSREPDDRTLSLLEAALFLELARDLDEKEMEVEAGLTKIDSLEGEFREILGITDEDELADTTEILSPPLSAEKAYLSFMLPKRIESWLRVYSNRMPKACPTLVTTSEQVVEELFEPVRAEYERAGKTFEPERVLLGSIPSVEDFTMDEFVNLLSNPEASALFDSTWHSLEQMLLAPHDPPCQEQMSRAADTLQDFLRDYRREIDLPEGSELQIEFVFRNEMRWGNLLEPDDKAGKSEQLAENSHLDDPLKILLCRV